MSDTVQPATWRDYARICRFDHATKHVFILPGIALAVLLRGIYSYDLVLSVLLGFATAVCIASANYAINEWLDREFDKFHPTKSSRAAVRSDMSGTTVKLLWLALVIVGLGAAALSGITMLAVAIVFALQGIVYNVPPLRTKDKAYLDVISESINNPLRLMIGWAMIDPTTLPPSSIILAYWLGGAFLMAAKRLSEYRELTVTVGRDVLARYRASFAAYDEISLTVSSFVYALLSGFFLAVFLIKYRIEYILLLPWITALFAAYLAIAMKPGSSAQAPEGLFRERGLILLVIGLSISFAITTFVDIPAMDDLTSQQFIGLPAR